MESSGVGLLTDESGPGGKAAVEAVAVEAAVEAVAVEAVVGVKAMASLAFFKARHFCWRRRAFSLLFSSAGVEVDEGVESPGVGDEAWLAAFISFSFCFLARHFCWRMRAFSFSSAGVDGGVPDVDGGDESCERRERVQIMPY